MQRQSRHHDTSWENDPVWKLLDHATPVPENPRFVDDTVRAARLAGQSAPWWRRVCSPAPLAGLAAAAAALAIAMTGLPGPAPIAEPSRVLATHGDFSEIQEIAETETLLSAVDQLDDFSDVELVSLIGF